MILYRLLGNIRKSGYFGIAHSLFTAHFKNVPLRGGQLLLSYRQLVDKVIVIYFSTEVLSKDVRLHKSVCNLQNPDG